MIVEHRTYTFRPGTVEGWLRKYESEGLPIQERHLNRFVGLFVSEIGQLHRTVLIWAYDDLADREARRKAMYADPEWQAFIDSVWKLDAIQSQDVMIMNPAGFSPVPDSLRQEAGQLTDTLILQTPAGKDERFEPLTAVCGRASWPSWAFRLDDCRHRCFCRCWRGVRLPAIA